MRIYKRIKRKLSEELTLTLHLILLGGLLIISSYSNPKAHKGAKNAREPFGEYTGKIQQADSITPSGYLKGIPIKQEHFR